MKITLEQFQTDYHTGLDSVTVGAQWLQNLMIERDKLQREVFALQKFNGNVMEEVERLKNKIFLLELKEKNIYILDTLA